MHHPIQASQTSKYLLYNVDLYSCANMYTQSTAKVENPFITKIIPIIKFSKQQNGFCGFSGVNLTMCIK